MSPQLRNTLGALGACVLAAYLGWQIAEGEYALPALCAVLIVAAVLVRLSRLPIDVITLGLLLVGYLVGNRGFAQLTPVSGLPLLPAELGLLVALGWRGLRGAFERTLPFRRDALNWLVLAWLVAGTVRVMFDLPRYGILAARDYAMVYYALFFFLAQDMALSDRAMKYLRGCLLFGTVLLLPLYGLFIAFPGFFLRQLTVRGTPLIYYKDDLAATFLAVGSLLLFHWARGRHRFWAWPLAAANFLVVAAGDNRASLLGLLVASALLLFASRWRYPALNGALAAVGLLGVIILGGVFENPWAGRKLEALSDRVQSIADVTGSGRYESRDAYYKGANNRFRLIWWKNVLEETWSTNPVLGLGFGSDLARGFLEEYYPDSDEDFMTRSPHSIFVTIAGRMGLVGLAVWGLFCFIFLRRTWHALRRSAEPNDWTLWCGAWVILVSASLGVVLENPMGAVLFWTLLGLANARRLAVAAEKKTAEPATAKPEPLPAATVAPA